MYRVFNVTAVCFFMFILWIIYQANTGKNSVIFDAAHAIPYGDKLAHMSLFGLLTFISIIALKFRTSTFKKVSVYHGVICVLFFVVLEELSQAYIPSRTFDFNDLVADFVGIGLAWFFALVIEYSRRKNNV